MYILHIFCFVFLSNPVRKSASHGDMKNSNFQSLHWIKSIPLAWKIQPSIIYRANMSNFDNRFSLQLMIHFLKMSKKKKKKMKTANPNKVFDKGIRINMNQLF